MARTPFTGHHHRWTPITTVGDLDLVVAAGPWVAVACIACRKEVKIR